MCLCLEKKHLTQTHGHIAGYKSLVTPREQIRAGFLAMALEKNRRAIPFVEEAKALKALASKAVSPKELIGLTDIQVPLLTAAGVSEKALKYLTEEDKEKAILNLIENFLEPAGAKFLDELLYRFLLIRGDTLGGKMRNIAGTLGEWKFIRTLISTLSIQSKKFYYLDKESREWVVGNFEDAEIEQRTKGLFWNFNGKPRTLLYNLTVPAIKKNVDLCLMSCEPEDLTGKGRTKSSPIHNTESYVALGEIKGEFDPAGADEHLKTANSALGRIRAGFEKSRVFPFTFFVGAAIEKEMAKEIFNQLQKGTLTKATNLTDGNQLVALCQWLTNI